MPTKIRMQWLDISRVLCMLLIVFMHFPPHGWENLPTQLFMESGVPFYLFWAGYFCAGNYRWNKILKRCFIFSCVYFLWESLAWIFNWQGNQMASFCGIGQFIVSQTGGGKAVPYIGPLWFVRDLIILTLFTPLFMRIKILIIPFILCFMSYQPLSIPHEPDTIISVGTCLIYLAGCYTRKYDIAQYLEEIKTVNLLIFLFITGGFSTLVAIKNNILSGEAWFVQVWHPTLFGYLCGTALISCAGVLIVRFIPKTGAFLASLAPAMLFVLILHIPLGELIQINCWLAQEFSILQAPILMIACYLLFMTLRRLTPWITQYIAAAK